MMEILVCHSSLTCTRLGGYPFLVVFCFRSLFSNLCPRIIKCLHHAVMNQSYSDMPTYTHRICRAAIACRVVQIPLAHIIRSSWRFSPYLLRIYASLLEPLPHRQKIPSLTPPPKILLLLTPAASTPSVNVHPDRQTSLSGMIQSMPCPAMATHSPCLKLPRVSRPSFRITPPHRCDETRTNNTWMQKA